MKELRSTLAFKAALCELLLEESLDDIRTIEICQRAGYSRSSFYESFYDKFELARRVVDDEIESLLEILWDVFDRFARGMTPTLDDCKFEFAQGLFNHIGTHRETYTCILDDRLMENTNDYMVEMLIRRLGERFVYRFEGGSSYYTYESFFLRWSYVQVFETARLWMGNGFDLSPSELAKLYAKTLSGVFFTSSGKQGDKWVLSFLPPDKNEGTAR